ncbi:unnamed protein product [Durusdinium trenchii]|uniref:Uncharacterized protein n=1 Tax=Durusdinium trenchii TaxID=1381693 RepID=A0ABP0NN64_9DINO
MDCCIARAAPRVELLPEAVTPATGWGRSTSDDDWSWPLEVSEERLPPVRSSPRRRTSSFRGSEKSFALLPSVGTWLQPLLRPSKASKAEAREPKAVPTPLPTPALRHVPLPEPIRKPMEQFQAHQQI